MRNLLAAFIVLSATVVSAYEIRVISGSSVTVQVALYSYKGQPIFTEAEKFAIQNTTGTPIGDEQFIEEVVDDADKILINNTVASASLNEKSVSRTDVIKSVTAADSKSLIGK